MNAITRKPHAMTLDEAARGSDTFARLAEAIEDSNRRLQAIQTLIPEGLRAAVKAGPAEDNAWCLVVANGTVAAKVKQLLPLFQARLRNQGWAVDQIRLRVDTGRR